MRRLARFRFCGWRGVAVRPRVLLLAMYVVILIIVPVVGSVPYGFSQPILYVDDQLAGQWEQTFIELRRQYRSERQKPMKEQSFFAYHDLKSRAQQMLGRFPSPPHSSRATLLQHDIHSLIHDLDAAVIDIRADRERTERERTDRDFSEGVARLRQQWAEEERQREAELARQRQREAEERERVIQQWPGDIQVLVRASKLRLGMTPEQVRMAWGPPQTIHETITVGRTSEQWVYGLGQYLYFEDGRLITIQQTRTDPVKPAP